MKQIFIFVICFLSGGGMGNALYNKDFGYALVFALIVIFANVINFCPRED